MALFEDRKKESDARIALLRQSLATQLAALPGCDDSPTLCIYATGSLARREATQHSDLDAFFLLSGAEKSKSIGRIRDVRILNAVLNAQEEGKFPDFSNDGAYLKFLHIEDVIGWIGHRDDDYKNAFTARMLFLLESEWIFNQRNFDEFRKKIINKYFQDYHDHSTDFRPVFLLNDILRFWRTLCLNYENSRHWRVGEDQEMRAKGHLDNLKLKFSRLNICYSFISHLLSQGNSLSTESVLITSRLTPYERLIDIADRLPDAKAKIVELLEEYQWFLEQMNRPRADALAWISQENERTQAFAHASNFVRGTGELVQTIANKNGYLRYLIV